MAESLLTRQLEVRRSMGDALGSDLVGPRAGADEQLDEPPLDRYITGILYPTTEQGGRLPAEQVDIEDSTDEGDESAPDPAVAMSNLQYPSSAGVTFAVDPDVASLTVKITAARYLPTPDEPKTWQRESIKARTEISVDKPGEDRFDVVEGLELYVRTRNEYRGARSVTVVLVNTLTAQAGSKDANSFYQVGFRVRPGDGCEPPFKARPPQVDVSDEDHETNALLYRNHPEFAVGHGCAADWEATPDGRGALEIEATFVPTYEVALMESNRTIDDDALRFDRLAEATAPDLASSLRTFLAGYSQWIESCRREQTELADALVETAQKHLRDCGEARDRIEAGITLLETDELARRAFQLANTAMADQMERAAASRGSHDDRGDYRWRPFQLAFILLTLPSLVDPDSPEREIAELLWFPTGGGKTEAYLGLFAVAVFHRRLARGGAAGVTAIMRYTLRLLTTQQFERASRVVCACERLRRDTEGLGDEPISIGLFVGSASTPNKVEDARKSLQRLLAGQPVPTENPCQLRACPWCDVPLDYKNYSVRENPSRLHIECRNEDCPFQKGLPVHVVDEDLYRARPTLIIGTVDKFAALPWRPEVGSLFNLGESSEPPPDLIIQDELHLISGPLGTMTGLYETAIDVLCSTGGHGGVPKIVASTATIRRAKTQTQSLFAREMRQFPPSGLNPGDSWFATEAPKDRVGARKYVGLMAPGVSHAMLLIRALSSLMNAASLHPRDEVIDPYWTTVGYFNSLRVLGAARMQVQDDVHDWLETLADGHPARKLAEPIELTSRVDSGDIPEYLERMSISLPDPETLDVVLATNMISVGVDVNRLGLMTIMGQPQAAAEYIQASSRVGRRHPGLVVTLLNAARSRDRSHYEAFRGFHEALYRSVEATSVTPFSPRARDRGLHAVLVALARLTIPGLRENEDASAAGMYAGDLKAVNDRIVERASKVDKPAASDTREQLEKLTMDWLRRANGESGLVYESWKGDKPALLTAAGPEEQEDRDTLSTMWSLRDVDAESNLYFTSVQ